MEAKEFRIGNLIESVATKPSELVIVDSYVLKCIEKNATWYRPIQLTEEWLLKFGFEKNGVLYEKGMFAVKVWKVGSDIEWVIFWGVNVILNVKDYPIHQLQNLYFALTAGNELELK